MQLEIFYAMSLLMATYMKALCTAKLHLLAEQVTAVDAAELWFVGVRVSVSDTELAWLYNLITNLAAGPIQDAITQEVASQVGKI